MKLSGSLWWTLIKHEFIVGDGKLWSRSGWICLNSSSEMVFLFTSLNTSSSLLSSLMCYSCASTRWVSLLVLPIGLMWSYRSKHCTEFTLGLWWTIVALVGPDLDVSTLMLDSLGTIPCLLCSFCNNFPKFDCWEDFILSEYPNRFCACSAQPGKKY